MSVTKDSGVREPASLSLFPFQLVDVRLHEVRAKRCPIKSEQELEVPFSIELQPVQEDSGSDRFAIGVSFRAELPLSKTQACLISLTLEGLFTSLVALSTIKPETADRFKSVDAIVLLWPYVRQYVHDLTTRMRLDFPPLPTLDVRDMLTSDDLVGTPADAPA